MGLFIKNSSHKFIFPSPLLCKLPQAVILCPTSLSQWQWLIESRKLHYLLMLHANHGSFIAYGLVSQCLYLFIYLFIFSGNLSQQRSLYVKNCWACGRERRGLLDLQGLLKLLFRSDIFYLDSYFTLQATHMTKPDINRAGKYNFSSETASGSFPISWLLTSGGWSICALAVTSVLPWIFRVNFL